MTGGPRAPGCLTPNPRVSGVPGPAVRPALSVHGPVPPPARMPGHPPLWPIAQSPAPSPDSRMCPQPQATASSSREGRPCPARCGREAGRAEGSMSQWCPVWESRGVGPWSLPSDIGTLTTSNHSPPQGLTVCSHTDHRRAHGHKPQARTDSQPVY